MFKILPGKALDEFGAEDAHESGQHDQRRANAPSIAAARSAIIGRARSLPGGRGSARAAIPRLPRDRESAGVGPVGDHRRHRIRRIGRAAALDERPHVAAASRYQDDDRLTRLAGSSDDDAARSAANLADRKRFLTRRLQ